MGEVDGQLFLSMEYVDGRDLATTLRSIGRFPQEKALDLSRQLCAGLTALAVALGSRSLLRDDVPFH